MESNKNISALIFAVAIIIATIIAAYTVNSYWQKKLVTEAVDGCAITASQADPSGAFNGAVYKICVEDKGYQTQIK